MIKSVVVIPVHVNDSVGLLILLKAFFIQYFWVTLSTQYSAIMNDASWWLVIAHHPFLHSQTN